MTKERRIESEMQVGREYELLPSTREPGSIQSTLTLPITNSTDCLDSDDCSKMETLEANLECVTTLPLSQQAAMTHGKRCHRQHSSRQFTAPAQHDG